MAESLQKGGSSYIKNFCGSFHCDARPRLWPHLAAVLCARYALNSSNNNHHNLLLNETLESRDVVRELKGCGLENSSSATKYSLSHNPFAIAGMTRVTKAPFSLLKPRGTAARQICVIIDLPYDRPAKTL